MRDCNLGFLVREPLATATLEPTYEGLKRGGGLVQSSPEGHFGASL